jgi:hypothetical protein
MRKKFAVPSPCLSEFLNIPIQVNKLQAGNQLRPAT